MPNKLQTRLLHIDKTQLKMMDTPHRFGGYASMFGGVDYYNDTIIPGAFSSTIDPSARERPVRMRWNHDGPVIGKWDIMREDEAGLYVEGELTPRHSVASDVAASIAHGAVDGMSIGFYPVEYEMTETGRNITAIDLVEISVVEEPADIGARIIGIKSAIEAAQSLKEVEHLLRSEIGLSRRDATGLVSRIKSIMRCDGAGATEHSDYVDLADMIRNTAKNIRGTNHE